jgi:hypothetical protein
MIGIIPASLEEALVTCGRGHAAQEGVRLDFFHAPDAREWQALRRSELPDLAGPAAGRLAVGTHMGLLADGDLVNQQEAIDAEVLARAFGSQERRS